MKELYAEPDEAVDAVELMTIHSAKGLEWDVVIVPELGRQGQRERARLLNWLELQSGSASAVLLAPIHGKGDERSSLYRWLDKVHCRRLEAERKRIFYVACTRAREELHLFATARQGKQTLNAASGSLLHACWPAAEIHFAEVQQTFESSLPAASTILQSHFSRAANSSPAGDGEDRKEGWLALAASSEDSGPEAPTPTAADRSRYLPRLTRLPLSFDPQQRFREAVARCLPYTSASELPRQEALARPEGSAAVRALGNVVHRFLEQIAARLAGNKTAAALHGELPTWLDRLTVGLRGEGLAPAEAAREASRALTLLANTLADPVGAWLLSPHSDAASERPLATTEGLLRVDRTFRSGDAPLSAGADTVWIVDFKTTAPGGRFPDEFLAEQRTVYGPQLARYADALRAGAEAPANIQLGLYFPAIPRLFHWPANKG